MSNAIFGRYFTRGHPNDPYLRPTLTLAQLPREEVVAHQTEAEQPMYTPEQMANRYAAVGKAVPQPEAESMPTNTQQLDEESSAQAIFDEAKKLKEGMAAYHASLQDQPTPVSAARAHALEAERLHNEVEARRAAEPAAVPVPAPLAAIEPEVVGVNPDDAVALWRALQAHLDAELAKLTVDAHGRFTLRVPRKVVQWVDVDEDES